MVEADEIVVDRLRDMDRLQIVVALFRLLGGDAHRIRGIVAADIEKRIDRVGLQDLEYFLAIFDVWLVAGRAERSCRRRGDRLEIGRGLLAEIDQVFVDDAAHAVPGAIDMREFWKPPGLQRDSGERLIDDRGRAAALRDENLVRHESLPLRRSRARRAFTTWLYGVAPERARAPSLLLFFVKLSLIEIGERTGAPLADPGCCVAACRGETRGRRARKPSQREKDMRELLGHVVVHSEGK